MFYAFLIACIITTALFIFVRIKWGSVWGLFAKIIASLAFFGFALYGAYSQGLTLVSMAILVGLLFGLIGDIVLDLKVMYKQHDAAYLNAGMLSFGFGHIMFLVAAVVFANKLFVPDIKTVYFAMIAFGLAGIISILMAMFGEKLLKLHFGKFKIQSIAYTFILSFMSFFSILIGCFAPKFLIFAVGITLIFVSDLVLSMQYFGGKADSPILTALNHAIYYAGQIAIAASIFLII